jgi:hypothetical protein
VDKHAEFRGTIPGCSLTFCLLGASRHCGGWKEWKKRRQRSDLNKITTMP